jgi:hypothetical protein
MIKAAQAASGNPFYPSPDLGFSPGRRNLLIENRGQLLLQIVGLLKLGRVTEEKPETALFFSGQISWFLAYRPPIAFQLLILAGGKLFFQPSQFLFAQFIYTVAISERALLAQATWKRSITMRTWGSSSRTSFSKAFIHNCDVYHYSLECDDYQLKFI